MSRAIAPEIPEPYSKDLKEAIAVLPISANASAALSRRVIQSVLRTAGGCKRSTLVQEIKEILKQGNLPSYISDNLHAVRAVGNLGAHEERDLSTDEVIDVEAGEAEWTLSVAESLLDHYFVRPVRAAERTKEFNAKLEAAGKQPLPIPQVPHGAPTGGSPN